MTSEPQAEKGPAGARLSGPPSLRPVGIVVAVEAERTILRKVTKSWAGLVPRIIVSGMGQTAAAAAAEQLAESGVCGLMSFGYAGAIRPGLRRGTVVIAEEVHDGEGRRYATDTAWRQQLAGVLGSHENVRTGAFVSVAAVASSPSQKAKLADLSEAVAVDMESAAIAGVAEHHAIPFIALRAIVDEAHHTVPSAVSHAVDASGRTRPWRLALPLLRRPAEIAALLTLARGADAADKALSEACRLAGPGFGLV